jgi:peptidylprolyl isomerase domain and WD repeat-containing protein 1
VVTASRDGQVKFWKKMQKGIEFVKHFRAHLAPISGCASTLDGSLLATTASDKAFKVFDVLSFDMINWVQKAAAACARQGPALPGLAHLFLFLHRSP